MADAIEIKDKVVSVESLSVLHEYNQNTYIPMIDPAGSGTMIMDGDADFSGNVSVPYLTIGSNIKLIPTEDSLEIVFLDEETATEEG